MISEIDKKIQDIRSKMSISITEIFSSSHTIMNTCAKLMCGTAKSDDVIEDIQKSVNDLIHGLNENIDNNPMLVDLLEQRKQLLKVIDDYGNVFKFENDHYYLADAVSNVIFKEEINGYPVNEIKVLPKSSKPMVGIYFCPNIHYKINKEFNINNRVSFVKMSEDFVSTFPIKEVSFGNLRCKYVYSQVHNRYALMYGECDFHEILSKPIMTLTSIENGESIIPNENFMDKSRPCPKFRIVSFDDCRFVFDENLKAFINTDPDYPLSIEFPYKAMNYPLYNVNFN